MGTKILTKKPVPIIETIVLKTDTHTNILSLSSDKQVVIDGEKGIESLKALAKASWDKGRDFEFRCTNIRFKRGE